MKRVFLIIIALLLFGTLCACAAQELSGGAVRTDSSVVSGDHSTDAPRPVTSSEPQSESTEPTEKLTSFEKLFADGPLLAQSSDGMWGFIDDKGNWVIDPQFSFTENLGEAHQNECGVFINGIAPAVDHSTGKWGFIDTQGVWEIEPAFLDIHAFCEGVAAAKDSETELWGYIDKNGEWVIEPQFLQAYDFASGLAIVQDADTFVDADSFEWHGKMQTERFYQYGFIDLSGNYAIAPEFSRVHSFHDGYASVWDAVSGKYGFIDTSGKMTIPYRWDGVTEFNNDRAFVFLSNGYSNEIYMIDKQGNILCEEFFPKEYAEGIDHKSEESGVNRKSYINTDDGGIKCILERWAEWEYDHMLVLSVDRSADYNDIFLINKDGSELLDFGQLGVQPLGIYQYGDGVCILTYDSKSGKTTWLDTEGNTLEPSTKNAGSKNTGNTDSLSLNVESVNGRYQYGYLHSDGTVAIEFVFTYAEPFASDYSYAKVKYDADGDGISHEGMIDREGNWLIPAVFLAIRSNNR